jgi:hypothetical protein
MINEQKNTYEMTSGYVGSMGKTWTPVDEDTANDALDRAAKFEKMDRGELIKILNDGRGCAAKTGKQSPNYCYDRGMEMIRSTYRKPITQPKMVRCSCGHTCEASIVMSASLGTSCPNCYDRMSD